MPFTRKGVDFTRYQIPMEIRFVEGIECCKWCNMSFQNLQRHTECFLTGEQMVSPGDSIGWECPLREVTHNEQS